MVVAVQLCKTCLSFLKVLLRSRGVGVVWVRMIDQETHKTHRVLDSASKVLDVGTLTCPTTHLNNSWRRKANKLLQAPWITIEGRVSSLVMHLVAVKTQISYLRESAKNLKRMRLFTREIYSSWIPKFPSPTNKVVMLIQSLESQKHSSRANTLI